MPDEVDSRVPIEARVVDGRFEWEALARGEQEQIYAWSVADDVVAGDRVGLVRVVRGPTALHWLIYEDRATDADALALRGAWLPRLRSAPADAAGAACAAGCSGRAGTEVVAARDALTAAPSAQTSAALLERARHALGLIAPEWDLALWLGLQLGIGHHLAGGTSDSDGAIAAYRRALEGITFEELPEIWARTMLSLGRMFDAREEGDRERNLQHAAAAYRQSLRVFPRGGEDWADATLSLADIEPPGEATVELYQDVVDALVEDFTFRGASEERSLEFGARATEGVQIAGRELMGGEVIVPEGFDDRKTLGPLIYLRPLMTSGRLILPNRFKDPAALTVQYEREPEEMTLEGVLNRILAEHFSVVTLGGRPEGYGASRIVIRDNWKQVFDFVLKGLRPDHDRAARQRWRALGGRAVARPRGARQDARRDATAISALRRWRDVGRG